MNYKELAHSLVELDKKENGMAFTYIDAIADMKTVIEWEAGNLLLDSLADVLEQKRRREFPRNNEIYFAKAMSRAENRTNIIRQAHEVVKWKEVKDSNRLHVNIDRLIRQGHLFAQVFNDDVEEIMGLLITSGTKWTKDEIGRKYIEMVIAEMDILKVEYYQIDAMSFENFFFLDSKESELLRVSLLILAKRKLKEEIAMYLELRNNPLPFFLKEWKHV